MSLPLADIRVLDFCQVYAGPAATMFLADQGADVIKIEPHQGDSARDISPIPETNALSQGYLALNRNKRGIIVDIGKPKGLAVAHRLVKSADVLVCNMRGGVPRRLHISYEDLAPINPRLIYASMTAYGEKGPDATLPGYDVVIQAKSGTEAHRRRKDGTPAPTSVFYNDMSGAVLTAFAVMVALRERERTGRGQKIEINLLHTALALQTAHLVKLPQAGQSNLPGVPRTAAGLASVYRCNDGRFIAFHFPTNRLWSAFCHAVGLESLAEAPAFDTLEKRAAQKVALDALLERHFSTRPAAEWDAILKAAGAPAAMVRERGEVFADPQVVANGMFAQFHQPGLGAVTAFNVPIRLSGSAHEQRLRRHAPEKGEHTHEVLRELGYSQGEIEELEAEGILG